MVWMNEEVINTNSLWKLGGTIEICRSLERCIEYDSKERSRLGNVPVVENDWDKVDHGHTMAMEGQGGETSSREEDEKSACWNEIVPSLYQS